MKHLLFWERQVGHLGLLSRLAETTARLRVEYPKRSPSHSSYIWDREIDGPEDLVVIREPHARSGREYLNLLLRTGSLGATCLCVCRDLRRRHETWAGRTELAGIAGPLALLGHLGAWPDGRKALLTFFQVLRQRPPGGGPQRPVAA